MLEMSTPEWFVMYFHRETLSEGATHSKWAAGLQAARLWQQYHDTKSANPTSLLEIIPILMPLRYDGSGFYDFWLTFVGHLQQLSVSAQIPLWRSIFDPQHHGARPIDTIEQVQHILDLWQKATHSLSDHAELVSALIEAFVHMGPDGVSQTKLQLLLAVDTWMQQVQTQKSLLDRVFERLDFE